MGPSRDSKARKKLLGALPFVGRTFEGRFDDTPFVLDMDANLYVGPADAVARDEHSTVEIIYHFLNQTGTVAAPIRDVLRDRCLLLDAFAAFDRARADVGEREFRILLHGTYDGDPLRGVEDDDLPAGPCGRPVNEVKLRFYRICRRLDPGFGERALTETQRDAEARLLSSAFARDVD